jgi:peptidyl-prolyl cis-trans isomerase D
MIRFLQTDNRLTKAIFVVIIGVVSVGMVVYLIPGLTGQGASSADTYAVIYPHWYSRFFSSGETVSQEQVDKIARQQLQQQSPQYADNPMMLGMYEQRMGQQLVQKQILMAEAEKLGVRATNDDVIQFLHTGQPGQVLFPNGQFIGEDQYAALIASRFNQSVTEFEEDVRQNIVIRRL